MSFDRDMKKAEKKINSAIEKAIRGAALELFSEIVRRTPVGNPTLWKSAPPAGYTGGRLRGNWQANINSPKSDKLNTTDKGGGPTISKASSAIKRFTLNDESIWFSNNLPYADRVERGWSKQRPQGMVRTTVKAFKPIIEGIAKRYKV